MINKMHIKSCEKTTNKIVFNSVGKAKFPNLARASKMSREKY